MLDHLRAPITLCLFFASVLPATAQEPLRLHLRDRAPLKDGPPQAVQVREQAAAWNPQQTAIVICDMWDKHWCQESTKRVGEMAPRMNKVVSLARQQGVFIIHCPSDTMDFYKDTPQRKRAQDAPVVEPKVPLERWNRIDLAREAPLPIDDSDGGCDDSPQPKSMKAWSRQHPALEIKDEDAITDSAEAYYLLRQRGIENVIVMGVHTNMCVLGRPFSIRQLSRQGLNVALMRDMTDAMYNPARAPQVSHARGTELVVEHIERYWCPSFLSSDLTGEPPLVFSDDKRPHVVFVVGEDEYDTKTTLPQFAADELLPRGLRCTFVHADEKQPNHFPLMKTVESADLLFLSVRRRIPPTEQLEIIRKYCQAGKPLVALRTSSHAFAARGGDDATAGWPTFDVDVLGAKYNGHYGKAKEGPSSLVWTTPQGGEHPITNQLPIGELACGSWLYKYPEVLPGTQVLLMGRTPDNMATEPAAWIRTERGRVFYTMQGQQRDFDQPAFRELLRRAVLWGLGR